MTGRPGRVPPVRVFGPGIALPSINHKTVILTVAAFQAEGRICFCFLLRIGMPLLNLERNHRSRPIFKPQTA